MAMYEIPYIHWTEVVETTTTNTDWIVGCKCGCEDEEECHGENGCDGESDG